MLPADLIAECQQLHTGSRRGYHGWSHPLALLALLPEVETGLFDSLAVECAILLHDAVCDPLRSDNERQSAELARRLLSGRVPTSSLERTIRLIEATERHLVAEALTPEEAQDTRIFLDMICRSSGPGPRISMPMRPGSVMNTSMFRRPPS